LSGVMPLDLLNNDKTSNHECQAWLDDLLSALPLKYEELMAELINNSETALCFDGLSYFNNTHKYGAMGESGVAASFDNTVTFNASDHTAITADEAARAINIAIEIMRVFPDTEGRLIANMGMKAVDIIVSAGTPNAAAIRQALVADTVDTGTGTIDNPLKGQNLDIRLLSDGLITLGETKMIVARSHRADAAAKPFAFQENIEDKRIDILGEETKMFIVQNDGVGVFLKMVGNAGYGLPSHAILTTFN